MSLYARLKAQRDVLNQLIPPTLADEIFAAVAENEARQLSPAEKALALEALEMFDDARSNAGSNDLDLSKADPGGEETPFLIRDFNVWNTGDPTINPESDEWWGGHNDSLLSYALRKGLGLLGERADAAFRTIREAQ